MRYEARIEEAAKAREAFYRTLGDVSPDVLAPIIGPALTGGPEWPTRPAWRPIVRNGHTLIASDGLSDPFEEEEGSGFGIEVFIEADEALGGMNQIPSSWAFAAVCEISNVCAGHGAVRELLDELGVISVEVGGMMFPAALRNNEGRVGALLGMDADFTSTFELPEGQVRFAPITILTLAELEAVVTGGDEGRERVADLLASAGVRHLSSVSRVSTI